MSSASNGSKVSEDFLGELIDEWDLMNLIDNDSDSESSGSCGSILASIVPNECSLEARLEMDRCYYKCGICGDLVLDYVLPKHHYHEHPDVSFESKIYERIEIDQTTHCYLCGSQVLAIEFVEHQKKCTKEICWSQSDNGSEEISIATSSGTQSVIISRIFKCEACGSLIFEDDLDEHHKNCHRDIPLNLNIYELFEVVQQESGEFSNKM